MALSVEFKHQELTGGPIYCFILDLTPDFNFSTANWSARDSAVSLAVGQEFTLEGTLPLLLQWRLFPES